MRFDDVVLKTPEGDLRLRFHPRLTVLCGLGPLERQALADGIIEAVRYREAARPAAADPDGAAERTAALRAAMLVRSSDLGDVGSKDERDHEPAELREARATLEALTAELQDALGRKQRIAELGTRLEALDVELAAARDGAARREYAKVLAQLERVHAEAAALQSGHAGIEADHHLLDSAEPARKLAARWNEATAALAAARERVDSAPTLDREQAERAAGIPAEVPRGLAVHLEAVQRAEAERERLDQRLQDLAVATLPAPSDPAVAELGVLDQDPLWADAHRLLDAAAELDRVQVAHGGLGVDDAAAPPAVVAQLEAAHQAVERAERSVAALRTPALAAAGVGLAAALAGIVGAPVLLPIGLSVAGIAALVGVVLPGLALHRAARRERARLAAADAPSYLSFHIRRVDASVDPHVRERVEAAAAEHRSAHVAWVERVGTDVDVRRAVALSDEVRAYNEALRSLGGAADEIEQLRQELAQRGEPALETARRALASLCEPFGLSADDLADTTTVPTLVQERVELGRAARLQIDLAAVEALETKASARLDELLVQLGFADGRLEDRVAALEHAVVLAAEREEARNNARPRHEIDAELRSLEESARRLRRPEWGEVTAAEASEPDISDLEAQRAEVAAELAQIRGELDVERLADRHAAIERRVAALDARHGGHDGLGDPSALAEIERQLLARFEQAHHVGPGGGPVPVVLDEVFMRVPAKRKYDLLDRLYALAEGHQLIYLSDDPFVAAWARQQAAAGSITLLEPAPA